MVDEGTLEEVDFGMEKKDDVDRELAKIGASKYVDDELAAIKAGMGK